MTTLRTSLLYLCLLLLAACKQPLVIEGDGDIIELNAGVRGCALEEFRAGWTRCTDNDVTDSESLRYRALPRAGWRFSHWDGICAAESRDQDCEITYEKARVEWWDESFSHVDPVPLKAVFVEDDGAPAAASYIASRFGVQGRSGYAALLDALLSIDGSYRYTAQQAGTRTGFDRAPASFRRLADGMLLAGPDPEALLPSGAATLAGDLLTLVDTDNSDGEISTTYLQPERVAAEQGDFNGTYYCGHILSNGQSVFFRANINGKGGGSMIILSDRQGRTGLQAQVSYEVGEDGTTTFNYGGARLAGSLSQDGSVFTATQISNSVQGAGICLRGSRDKRVANVAGGYTGAWMSTQPVTGVTELLLDNRGQTVEAVVRDSVGGRNYALGPNFMLVLASGQIETRDADGAVSPDGRILFIVQTDPNKFPTLIVYVRKT